MAGVVSGGLVALFQLVGRSPIARFGNLGDTLGSVELRLLVLIMLSSWLAWLVAVRGPGVSLVGDTMRLWRNMIAAFILYMVGTSLWAPDVDLAVAKSYDVLFVMWSSLLTITALRLCGSRSIIEGFWTALFVVGTGLVAAAVAVVISGGGAGERLSILGGGPNVFGRNMGLVSLAALHLILARRSWLRILALGVAPLSVLFVLQSGSRGAMLSLFIGLVVYLTVHKVERGVILSMLLLAFLGALLIATRFGELAVSMFRDRFILLLLVEGYFTNRDTLLLDGLIAGLQHPVGGLGLAGFVQLDSPGTYPHNVFVEALAEGGVVGLVLLCLPFFSYVGRWRRGMGPGDSLTVAGLSLLVVSSSLSGDLFDARGVFLLLIMAVASQISARAGVGYGR